MDEEIQALQQTVSHLLKQRAEADERADSWRESYLASERKLDEADKESAVLMDACHEIGVLVGLPGTPGGGSRPGPCGTY